MCSQKIPLNRRRFDLVSPPQQLMVPISGNREPNPTGASSPNIHSFFPPELADRIDVPQMFVLIDGVLPFEACLYYQVLPLHVEGSRISLGMVNPTDTSAADYVRRIVAYHNYLVTTYAISSQALQSALSAYLNHAGKKSAIGPSVAPPAKSTYRPAARTRKEQPNPDVQPTLIVDSPDLLENEPQPKGRDHNSSAAAMDLTLQDLPTQARSTQRAPEPSIDSVFSLSDAPLTTFSDNEEPSSTGSSSMAARNETGDRPSMRPSGASQPKQPGTAKNAQPFPLIQPISEIKVQLQYLASPMEVIATLAPNEMLQELLGRVLVGGIGRLYFEQQSGHGRVLWSQDGVLQSVLDHLDSHVFQGLIHELKRLAGLSLIPVERVKQIDIERLYNRQRLLLRFRFIPTAKGEEATLQVLRGAALRFYKQQQMAVLERDALGIARQLQNKLNEIRDRAADESGMAAARLDALPALQQLLRSIEDQIETLQAEEPDSESQGDRPTNH
ncbi:hypothetical protein ACQ4M4_00830 [Leptolyngbya sp. AN02str]